MLKDVVLGYDTIEEYESDTEYLGATVGRYANRIAGGRFSIGAKQYLLNKNDGANHLHGGIKGFNRFVWQAYENGDGITFSRLSPDGEEGYPGNLRVSVNIRWRSHILSIFYRAECDSDTVINLTNHSYFNLSGEATIKNHILQLNSGLFFLNDSGCLPTGAVLPVNGTVMDFRAPRKIGDYNYDNSFSLKSGLVGTAFARDTGIKLTVRTTEPGVQLYTAKAFPDIVGKGGQKYGALCGLCLETQHFPDSPNHPAWPSTILRRGEIFESSTTYQFETVTEETYEAARLL